MSMISEQVNYLRNFDCFGTVKQAMLEAADTIEFLSAKSQAVNVRQSVRGNEYMTLNEAIDHLNDVLRPERKWECEECRNEHIQLREWLLELQERRKFENVAAWRELPEPYHEP